jgi:Heparinase II/III-like protein/Heparinase II/III N-terminus
MGWYLSRLASMAPAEIIWRARNAVRKPLDWARLEQAEIRVPAPNIGRLFDYPVCVHADAAAINAISFFDLEFPPDFDFEWHRDYAHDKQVAATFAPSLNIRNTKIVGDIKYIWEINRHQHLSSLAYAANANRHSPYIVRSLSRWLEQNPYLRGVNWTSSLELALRVISWVLLYPRIEPLLQHDRALYERWLRTIYLHLARIAENLSMYSSANNHLIGELAGLYVGALCFPLWPECKCWTAFAQQRLEDENFAQVGADGVNREQALSYHLFTLELFLLAQIVGGRRGYNFSERYTKRLQAMLAYLDVVATPTGDLPWYGDSDDGRAFLFSPHESTLAVVMQLGALFFAQPNWLRLVPYPTAAARALVPAPASHRDDEITHPPVSESVRLFHDAGLACVTSVDGRVKLLMDFGPLGYTSIAAHGHADALALWLAVDDEYFLVDAGTYAYHSHADWRSYFRSTAAHNTARVDACDQSIMSGPFLWSWKAKARLLSCEERDGVVNVMAEHYGYKRLSDAVVHRRTLQFDTKTATIAVTDGFECTGRHEIELFFHMHEDTEVLSVECGGVEVSWRGRRIAFTFPMHCSPEILRGSDAPLLGWRSRAFNQKQPIPTLRISGTIVGPASFRTCIAIRQ